MLAVHGAGDRRAAWAAAVAFLALALLAPPAGGDPAARPQRPELALTPVASLARPVAMAVRAGDPALYVAEKGGRVRAIRGGTVDPVPVLDLSTEVSTGGEQGLLGLAFAPAGNHLYVNLTDLAGDTRVLEYAVVAGTLDLGSRREVLTVDQPFANHNGGNLVFGPDGNLWIGLGDGGSGNDPQDNAQRLDTLLGKMLRVDPRPSGEAAYTVPADNPFAGMPGARPEIWALGLRHPWRYSFDRATGDLWIGDVGQARREEVDLQPAGSGGGENYGWARLEGTLPVSGTPPPGAVPPLYEYDHSDGSCAVTGGYVYRGRRVRPLSGTYIFADFCKGELQGLVRRGHRVDVRSLGVTVPAVASFGEDAAGELYVLSLQGMVYRIDRA
jgi:glucose/arabinose dehydrogenase